jgi:hypothetical protein
VKPDSTLQDPPSPNPTSDAPFTDDANEPPSPICPSEPLANPKHEAFAFLQATGRTAGEAYQAVFHSERLSTAQSNSARLRARPEVIARIRHLQSEAATTTVMNLREILEFLTRVKRTPIGEIDAGSDLVRRFLIRPDGTKSVSMLDKRACVELAARLQGFLRLSPASSYYPDFSTPDANLAAEPLTNPRHEAFARLHATGLSGRKAYAAVYGVNRPCTGSNAHVIQGKPEVIARVNYLKTEAAKAAVMDCPEILEFLTRIKRAAAGELDENSDLIQRLDVTRHGRELRLPNKFACIKLAAKLQGFLRAANSNVIPHPNAFTREKHLRLMILKRKVMDQHRAMQDNEKLNAAPPSSTAPL